MYDYIIDNLDLLNDKRNIIITPTLTTGIPSLEYFIDDFLTVDQATEVRNEFNKYTFSNIDWYYSSLNINKSNKWNYNIFYDKVSKLNHPFKGIHPLRPSQDLHELLNKYVVKYKNELMSKRDYILYYDNTSPYICNNIFCIKTEKYKEIVNNKSLFADGCDEVPLNRQRDIDKSNIIFVRNGAAIHAAYNTVENNLIEEHILKELEFTLF